MLRLMLNPVPREEKDREEKKQKQEGRQLEREVIEKQRHVCWLYWRDWTTV